MHETDNGRNILIRGLYMLLMCFAYQITGTLVFVVSVVQFAIVLSIGEPNASLREFGASLGGYLQQIAGFLTFAVETVPFPFAPWSSGGRNLR